MKKIQLIQVWSANPGVSGVATLEIRGFRDHVEVWSGPDDSEPLEMLFRQPGSYSWRSVVRELCNAEGGTDDRVEIEGATGLEAEMLKMAWSGPDTRGIARALLDFSDEQLSRLAREEGGLPGLESVVELRQELDEFDAVALLAELVAGASDLSLIEQLETLVGELSRVADEEDQLEAALRAERLEPWSAAIEELVEGCAVQFPQNDYVGHRLAKIRRYVEASLLSNSRLPTGRHEIPDPAYNYRTHRFTVDFPPP